MLSESKKRVCERGLIRRIPSVDFSSSSLRVSGEFGISSSFVMGGALEGGRELVFWDSVVVSRYWSCPMRFSFSISTASSSSEFWILITLGVDWRMFW